MSKCTPTEKEIDGEFEKSIYHKKIELRIHARQQQKK